MRRKIVLLFCLSILFSNIAFSEEIPVKLTSKQLISTSKGTLHEGDYINLVSVKDVYSGSKLLIKQGAVATGLVTSLVDNDFCSVPAQIYAEQFRIKNVSGRTVDLNGIVVKKGRNHFMFNQFIPFVINFERGGEAFIYPSKDIFTLYVEVKDD